MNVIWLCSWYPNAVDAYRGDFIQRQAIATSAFARIDVVHIVFCDYHKATVTQVNAQLTEHIFYVKQQHKGKDLIQFFAIHKRFLLQYQSIHGLPDRVHVQIPLWSGLIAMQWKRIYQIPFVLTEHYGIYNLLVDDSFQHRSWLFKYFTKSILKAASLFLPVSNSLGKEVNSMVISKPFIAVPNVVNTNLFHFTPKPAQGKFRFIHVSNMAPLKNVLGILEALSKLYQKNKEIECVLIGSQSPEIIAYATSLQLYPGVCRFYNEISYEEVALQVSQAHAGVLFSTSESQSCVVLEWLCSGLPVISSAVGGVVELIQAENGLLVASHDVDALAHAMESLIDHYHEYDGVKIASRAAALYSYEAVGKQFCRLYETIISRK